MLAAGREPTAPAILPMPCRLIINADDFGWSTGVNQAVAALFDDGILTSTSLMVGAPAAAGAVDVAASRPGMAVGLHLALCDAPPVLPPEEVPALVDAKGWLSRRYLLSGLRISASRRVRGQARAEVRAQLRAFAETGLPLAHLDTHLHLGLVPALFRIVLEELSEYPGRKLAPVRLRIPEDDFPLHLRIAPADALRNAAHAAWFGWSCARQRPAAQRRGFRATRRCYGFFRSGRLDAAYLTRLIAELPEGEAELHCHPDLSTPAGRAEFDALRSRELRNALAARGVELWFGAV